MSNVGVPPPTPLRLTLISHAMTDALRQARFPLDEPLTEIARNSLSDKGFDRQDLSFCGPEDRTRQTARALGLDCAEEAALADLDHGGWAGMSMAQLPEPELLSWLTDPEAAPHGGESVAALIERVGSWLAGLAHPGARIAAVTHPAVIRAALVYALDAPAAAFWRLDIAPASSTVLHGRGRRWTVRSTSAALAR